MDLERKKSYTTLKYNGNPYNIFANISIKSLAQVYDKYILTIDKSRTEQKLFDEINKVKEYISEQYNKNNVDFFDGSKVDKGCKGKLDNELINSMEMKLSTIAKGSFTTIKLHDDMTIDLSQLLGCQNFKCNVMFNVRAVLLWNNVIYVRLLIRRMKIEYNQDLYAQLGLLTEKQKFPNNKLTHINIPRFNIRKSTIVQRVMDILKKDTNSVEE